MSNVELCLDFSGLVHPETRDVLVVQVSDYAAAYVAMAHALHGAQPLRIVVRHRACAEWLCQAQAKYGPARVVITQTSYRSSLEQRWSVRVPEWLPDGDLAASRLLELPPLQAASGQSFEDLVLEAFWGAAFTYPKLPLAHLAELANGFVAEGWQAAQSVPVARAVLTRRLAQWEGQTTQPGERLLIAVIRETPEQLRGLLSQLRVLRRYPQDVGLRCVGEDYTRLAALRLDLAGLTIDGSVLGQPASQVQVYLQNVAQSEVDEASLGSVVEQMSGDLVAEFDWIEGLLRSGRIRASRALLDKIADVFRPIQHRVAHRLSDLELLIEPPRPSEPSSDWGTELWITWAIQEYLPYRFWLEARGALDEEVANYANAFGDWLFAHFPEFVGSYERLAYRAILNLKDALKRDQILLFVILDNFGFRYVEELRTLMMAGGYGSAEPVAYLSMLPSATEISKKAMAAADPSGFPGTAYRDTVETTWRRQFHRKTKYLGRVGDLQELSSRDHEVYVLNYTPIDDALHSDPRSTGVSYTQAVRLAMTSLVSAIHDFALRFGIEDSLRVVVCSDHGSTLIPADTPNVIDAAFIAQRVDDIHHRYVALTDMELDALPQSVRDQCYCFRSGVFGLASSYLAARAYGRLRKSATASFVHGGLTPEETLVPLVSFERMHVSVQKPTVRLLENVFRYGVRSRVRLEIVNTNALPLQRVRIAIAKPQGATEPYALADPIEAGAIAQPVLDPVRFRDTQGEVEDISLVLAYECGGAERRDEYVLPVTMRRIMTNSFDLPR
jgi:hypothetical protein